MKTRVIITLDHLPARDRDDLPELLDDALGCLVQALEEFYSRTESSDRQINLAKRFRSAVWNMTFIDVAMIVPDPDGDHPKREEGL